VKSLKLTVKEYWQKEALTNLFGEEDIFDVGHEPDDSNDFKEYQLQVTVKRGKEIKR
jgi:hypothetical protein